MKSCLYPESVYINTENSLFCTEKDTAVLTESGRYVTAPVAVVPEIKKQTSAGKPRGATISTAELLARTIGSESWEVRVLACCL